MISATSLLFNIGKVSSQEKGFCLSVLSATTIEVCLWLLWTRAGSIPEETVLSPEVHYLMRLLKSPNQEDVSAGQVTNQHPFQPLLL